MNENIQHIVFVLFSIESVPKQEKEFSNLFGISFVVFGQQMSSLAQMDKYIRLLMKSC